MKKQLNNLLRGCLLLVALTLVGCSSDHNLDERPVDKSDIKVAQKLLDGEIVLSTKATMNGVDKTLLPSGCPTKFKFAWVTPETMRLQLLNFTVGNMPLTITFTCLCKFMQLNSWEKNEYKDDGWLKFIGRDGVVSADDKNTKEVSKGSGSKVDGYLNVKTQQIIFIVDYNMMNVRSECFLQTIDKNRIKTYNEDFKKYEEDLKKYKEEHGL